jgi:ferrous iron transport protein B
MGVDLETYTDVILLIADASNLKRNLLFCSQIIDLKKPVVLALTMNDLAAKKGIKIDIAGLQADLGIPVVAVDARKNKGLQELKTALNTYLWKNYYLNLLITIKNKKERIFENYWVIYLVSY